MPSKWGVWFERERERERESLRIVEPERKRETTER